VETFGAAFGYGFHQSSGMLAHVGAIVGGGNVHFGDGVHGRNNGAAHTRRAFLGVVSTVKFQLAVFNPVPVERHVDFRTGVTQGHRFTLTVVLHGAWHQKGQGQEVETVQGQVLNLLGGHRVA